MFVGKMSHFSHEAEGTTGSGFHRKMDGKCSTQSGCEADLEGPHQVPQKVVQGCSRGSPRMWP